MAERPPSPTRAQPPVSSRPEAPSGTAFVRLLLGAAGPARTQLVVFVALTGLGMAATVAIVNSLTDRKSLEGVDYPLLLIYVMACVLIIGARTRALALTTRVSEATVERLRIRLTELIRRADLDAVEALGAVRIYGNIARDTATLSEAGSAIIYSASSAAALLLAGLYIAAYSPLAFVVIVVLFVATVFLYRVSQRTIVAHLVHGQQAESEFFDALNQLLQGFKEVKMSVRRAEDLEATLARLSISTGQFKVQAKRGIDRGLNIVHGNFYLLLAAIVFAIPQYLDSTPTAMKIMYAVVFMLATIEVILKAVPMLAQANLAIEHLARMEAQLVAASRAEEAPPVVPSPTMGRIEARGIVYAHTDADGRSSFTVGPCHLTLEAGEVVFLVGGNGSGKSTLLRVLTWLYEPRAGAILWNGQLVDRSNVVDYRNLFATVFSDFHLFDRLYGLQSVDPAQAQALLETMGLAEKTAFRDGRFTNLDLSTGQRKRLALVAALLEDKPVYVLDELAADQDRDFRHQFYEELLPWLKRQGKTLVVVSHDERYFHVADRVLVMENGRVEEEGSSH